MTGQADKRILDNQNSHPGGLPTKAHEKPNRLPLFIFLMLLFLLFIGVPVISIILALLLMELLFGFLLNPNDVGWVMIIITPLLVIAVFIWWMMWAKEFRC